MKQPPYSFRSDPNVPDFDDSKPLFVFDNVCVLCSGGAGFIMRFDRKRTVNFTSAQGELGEALCRHYGLDWDKSYLFVRNGQPYTKSSGYFQVARALGGIWTIGLVFQIVPRQFRDWIYDAIARNRYKWFGRTKEACAMLTREQRERLI